MHTQRRYATCLGMSKRKKERRDSPLSKKKEKERDGAYKGVHTPSTKNIHILAHLDQGLWLVSSLDPVFDLAKHEKQVCLQILHTNSSTKIAIKDRLRKKGTIKRLGMESYTLSDPRDHSRNFINFFENLYKTSELTVELKRKKYEHSMMPFWLSTAKDEVKL